MKVMMRIVLKKGFSWLGKNLTETDTETESPCFAQLLPLKMFLNELLLETG